MMGGERRPHRGEKQLATKDAGGKYVFKKMVKTSGQKMAE